MTPAYAILATVGAAAFFALADIFLRNALRFTTPVMASIATVAVQWLSYTALILATGRFSSLNASGLLWFAVAGLLNPVLFLVFYLLGIQRIGVARSSPLKGSSPIFAVACAAAVLGERLHALQYLGIALVIGGILIISTEGTGGWPRAARASAPLPSVSHEAIPLEAAARRKIDFFFPLLAGAVTGVSSILFKISLGELPSPLLGAWIGTAEGLLFFPLLAFFFPRGQRFRLRPPAYPWLVLGGLAATVAVYGLILAIELGQVSIVATLVQTSPLFVLLLSVLFLRQTERVTPRVVLGGTLTVGGGVLASLF